jgi:hypothetical protein
MDQAVLALGQDVCFALAAWAGVTRNCYHTGIAQSTGYSVICSGLLLAAMLSKVVQLSMRRREP